MINDNLSAILDALSEAVFVIDANREILLANGPARDLFGVSPEGQDFVRVVRHPDCLNCIADVLGGKPESRAIFSQSNPVPAVYQISVVGLAQGLRGGPRAVVSIDDISHVHEAEQMRRDFVANVSHELRSPLTALTGFIETLKSSAAEDLDARQHFLDVMDREARRMNRLIDDLLSLSKVEFNERIRPTGHCDLRAILERVVTTLEGQAEEEGARVALQVPDRVGSVPGDEDQLTQVFQNLIENGIKYGGDGADVTVTVELLERAAGLRGPSVSITVSDTGPGIDSIHIPRLTERFYRVDAGRSRDHGGTGLGLAIVKHIVSRHRGRLQISSEIGVGSKFTVKLPATNGVRH